MAQKKASKSVGKTGGKVSAKGNAKSSKSKTKAAPKAASSKVASSKAPAGKTVAAKAKPAAKAAPVVAPVAASKVKVAVKTKSSPEVVEPKQTKKQSLLASKPQLEAEVIDAAEEKSIKKAKKALGKAKQNLAKARAKDFGSKLGKNLMNQGMDELAKKWESLFKKSDGIESKPYRMKDSFEERTAIMHKILGWGFVLSNQNDRLEVLFRDGIRYLISNYKT